MQFDLVDLSHNPRYYAGTSYRMNAVRLPIGTILFIFALSISLLLNTSPVKSVASHVVISEIQVAGDTADDEFVELYNPTDVAVDLTGWKLTRKTSTGGSQNNLVASISGTIAAHGFFLIANPAYNGTPSADMTYSATTSAITASNIVYLYNDTDTDPVDKVGMGTADDPETAAASNPATHGSIERKASSASDSITMGTSGEEENDGNGEDTDNNANDFVLQTVSNPQNSSSALETPPPPPTPTPTDEPTPTPSPTDEPTPTPTDTQTPTPTETPTPTITPSPTPTETPSPTLTPTVTQTPTDTVTETPTPTPPEPDLTPTVTMTPTPTITGVTPTVTPTQTATPTIKPPKFPSFPIFAFSCKTKVVPIKTPFSTLFFPFVTCSLEKK